MDRAFLADVSEIPPSPPETPLIGYPRNGDPASGVRATKPGAWWYHMIEEEILNVIRDAGLTPDPKKVDQLVEAINKRSGVPIGTVEYFAKSEMPPGYLLATGQAVGRATYPELFAAIGTAYGEGDGASTFNLPGLNREIGAIVPFASLHMPQDFMLCDGRAISRADYAELFAVIGTTYGEGDGTTTFNLPDLTDRFLQGSATPGTVKEAGLPDLEGEMGNVHVVTNTGGIADGLFSHSYKASNLSVDVAEGQMLDASWRIVAKASDANPIYGNSNTVQPPALTVCYGIRIKNQLHAAIKAFDASTDPGLVDLTELANDIQRAQTPVGTVAWFAMSAPPVGYLVANGAAVGRATYPDLFAAIGTTYGEGDGSTTFNLPNLIGRFAEGSATPGTVKEAGLPEIAGETNLRYGADVTGTNGACRISSGAAVNALQTDARMVESRILSFVASRSNPTYGASDTVQPPALTLLPCIKAFDATVNSGLIDVTELAQEMAGKVDKVVNGKNIAYVVDSYNDMQGNWWREWSDGWLEQGGLKRGNGIYAKVTVNLLRPFSGQDYTLTTGSTIGGSTWYTSTSSTAFQAPTSDVGGCFTDKTINSFNIQGFSTHLWYACGVKGD